MSNTSIPGFDIDWAAIYDKFQAVGVDFSISLVTAIIIFFVGRIVARFISRGLRKLMQAQNVDKILESFVSNLVYWALMAFVIAQLLRVAREQRDELSQII